MSPFKQFTLKTFTSKGYSLTPVEFKDIAPFEVKRMYYLTNFEAAAHTGEHCHYVEQEVFIVAKGSVTAIIDRGQGKEEITLTTPGEAFYAPAYSWHGFKDASNDCVLIALTSTNYSADRSDYLEDYEKYLTLRDEHLSK